MFLQPVDADALRQAVSLSSGLKPEDVCLYEDTSDIDAPSGRLWQAYARNPVSVFLRQIDPKKAATPGWFSIETMKPADNDLDDRPVATIVAAALGERIIFRDPVPDTRDGPFVESAQIGVVPLGQEEALWLTEYGDGEGGDVTEILRRSELSIHAITV